MLDRFRRLMALPRHAHPVERRTHYRFVHRFRDGYGVAVQLTVYALCTKCILGLGQPPIGMTGVDNDLPCIECGHVNPRRAA